MVKKILKPKKVKEVKIKESVEEVSTETVIGPAVEVEEVVEIKKVEEPKFEVVVINEKSYKKFSRPDGTTYLEGPI